MSHDENPPGLGAVEYMPPYVIDVPLGGVVILCGRRGKVHVLLMLGYYRARLRLQERD